MYSLPLLRQKVDVDFSGGVESMLSVVTYQSYVFRDYYLNRERDHNERLSPPVVVAANTLEIIWQRSVTNSD